MTLGVLFIGLIVAWFLVKYRGATVTAIVVGAVIGVFGAAGPIGSMVRGGVDIGTQVVTQVASSVGG